MTLRQFLLLSLRGYKTFSFFCACSLLIAIAIILISPKKWEVTCIVSPPVRMAPHLDTAASLLMRLREPSTMLKVIGRLKSQEGIDISYKELKKSMRVYSIGDNVEMQFDVPSGETGVKLGWFFLQEINNQEKEYLAIVKDSEKAVQKEIAFDIKNIFDYSPKSNGVQIQYLFPKEFEHINKEARSHFLVEPNYDPQEIWPNKILLVSMAIIIGLMLGVIKLFFYDGQALDM